MEEMEAYHGNIKQDEQIKGKFAEQKPPGRSAWFDEVYPEPVEGLTMKG